MSKVSNLRGVWEWIDKDRKQKRPSVLKGNQLLHLARVHNNCDHSKNKLLYVSFLWQNPTNVMQATKIDIQSKRRTNAA